MELKEEDINLYNSTTRLLFSIHKSLLEINSKLDRIIPIEDKPKKKKGDK